MNIVNSDIASENAALRAEVIRTEDGFRQLAPEWMDLFDRSRSEIVFLTSDWMEEWWARWNQGRTLLLIAIRNAGGELVALAPLSIRHSSYLGLTVRSVCFLASEIVGSDHLDILVEPGYEDAAASEIASHLMRYSSEWDYIDLSDTDEDSFVATRVRECLVQAGMRVKITNSAICPYMPLPPSFEAYLATLKARVRREFKRRTKVLDRQGDVEFRTLTGGFELERGYEELMRLHSMRSQQLGRSSTFMASAIQDFHRSTLFRLARRGRAALHILRVRGEAVAALYSFSSGGRFMFYQCGMDPAWGSLAVGMLTLANTIDGAIREGHHEYDFLRGDEVYKSVWTKQARFTMRLRLFDNRWRSRLAHAAVQLAQVIRRWKHSIVSFMLASKLRFRNVPENTQDAD